MSGRRWWRGPAGALLSLLLTNALGPLALRAQSGAAASYRVLHAFAVLNADGTNPDGANPNSALVQDAAGNLYGTTSLGGSYGDGTNGYGTVYRLGGQGTSFAVLHAFAGGAGDGAAPSAGLLLGPDNLLYGTTTSGGRGGYGTVYRLDPRDGTYVVLHAFADDGVDGLRPSAPLVLGGDGVIYGTTGYGGSNGQGTVYRLDPRDGSISFLRAFAGGAKDGALPLGAVLFGADGNLYGTTASGGKARFSSGTVYRLGPGDDRFDLLHAFFDYNADGSSPASALVQAGDGSLYGTAAGGSDGAGTLFRVNPGDGTFAVGHQFHFETDGSASAAGLVRDAAGRFYGTAAGGPGSVPGAGAVYRFDPRDNSLATIHVFTFGSADGAQPAGAPLVGADGNIYGTTYAGGPANRGVVYRLTPGN